MRGRPHCFVDLARGISTCILVSSSRKYACSLLSWRSSRGGEDENWRLSLIPFPLPPPSPPFPIPAIVRGLPALYSRQKSSTTGSPSLAPFKESKHDEERTYPPFFPFLLSPSPPLTPLLALLVVKRSGGWVGDCNWCSPRGLSIPYAYAVDLNHGATTAVFASAAWALVSFFSTGCRV